MSRMRVSASIPGAAVSAKWQRRLVLDLEGIREESAEPVDERHVTSVAHRIADGVQTRSKLESEKRRHLTQADQRHVVEPSQVFETPQL